MNFDWEALFEVASDLLDASDKASEQKRQALLRSAASRAYYAAFGAATVWVQQRHPKYELPSHGELHQAVADYFLFHQTKEFRVVGEKLRGMRLIRNQVDYQTRLQNVEELARLNLFNANRVLNALMDLKT